MLRIIAFCAYSLLGLAAIIDLGLFAYYSRLSLDTIDALWNLPFILTWPAAFFSFLAFSLFLLLGFLTDKRSSHLVAGGMAIATLICAVLLFCLTSGYIFMR